MTDPPPHPAMHAPPARHAGPLGPAARQRIDLMLELGRALHSAGAPTHRIEDALSRVAANISIEAQFFSTPTSLFCAFGHGADQITCLLRVEPSDVNLERLTRVDEIASGVASEAISLEEGAARLRALGDVGDRYPAALSAICFGVAAASAARFFGGSWNDLAASMVAGTIVGALAIVASRHRHLSRIIELTAGFVAAALALVAERSIGGASSYTITVSAVIVLLPGLTLTLAINELATRHLVAGTARLTGALMIFISIGFGVALGRQLTPFLPALEPGGAATAPGWTKLAALALAPLAFTVLFRARPRDIGIIAIASVVGFYGARLGAWMLGPELGVSLGAFLVGTLSNLYSRLADRPAAIPAMPGMMLLVPGSIGFRSLDWLLREDVVSGIDAGFTVMLVAVSLVAGLLFANVAVPARKAL